MWLLATDHLELRGFSSPEEVSGGYAALSHVWIGEEQTFQDIQELIQQGAELNDPRVSDKIRGACRVARDNGHAWIWIDTCCIDKTSSAELSEAINSMFRWYALSRMCYAYLHDVSSGDGLHDRAYSPFRLSRWFTRGWTLQELIAPRFLLFMSSDWTPLGSKAALSSLVESMTGIDAAVLTFARDIGDVSVARRMSWASSRHTTRLEDEAYCLMGLFGVNMSTLYGEGRDAFRRLQEEIMKRTSDHSLFAWGATFPSNSMSLGQVIPDALEAENFLFAPSPAAFVGSAGVFSVSQDKVMNTVAECLSIAPNTVRHAGELTITSYGVRCQLLVIHEKVYHLAVLACQNEVGQPIGLLLRQRQSSDGSLPQYYVGASFLDDSRSPASGRMEPRRSRVYRTMTIHPRTRQTLITLTQLHLGRRSPQLSAYDDELSKEIYIIHRPPHVAHAWMRLFTSEPNKFFVPTWMGVEPGRFGFKQLHDGERKPNARPRSADPSTAFQTIIFANPAHKESFTIELGRCTIASKLWATVSITAASYIYPIPAYTSSHTLRDTHHEAQGTSHAFTPPVHVAFATPQYLPLVDGVPHRPAAFLTPQMMPGLQVPGGSVSRSRLSQSQAFCSTYHISSWETGSMSFGDKNRTVQLTFTRWPAADSYCIEIRLQGLVYEKMLAQSLVSRDQGGKPAPVV